MTDNVFTYQCPNCNSTIATPLEEVEEDITVKCDACRANIYWHSCQDCLCGWYDLREHSDCPDCAKLKPAKSIDSLNKVELFFSKPCPWCQYPINMLTNIRYRRFGFQCSACHKLVTVHRVAYVALFSIIILTFLSIFTPLGVWYRHMTHLSGMHLTFIIYLICYWGFIYTLSVKLCHLKKYKYKTTHELM